MASPSTLLTRRAPSGHLYRACLAVLLGALALSACERTPDARCEELAAIIEAKSTALPRACRNDLDCFVTEITPGHFEAVSARPEDPAFDAAIAEHVNTCDPGFEQLPLLEARCLSFSSDDPAVDPLNLCALWFDGQVVLPDIVEPGNDVVPNCSCASHSDCGTAELCQGGCQCLPTCEAACRQVDGCGASALADLLLGTSVGACVAVCEANLADPRETNLAAQVQCLATEPCATQARCMSL